ncbi:hypothetical protein Taro_021468 [Colocasia esculenta]|uniref:GDSL esterase/lipase n=1 Tax=Colocasia esculenta TaxID=4460 RepID=A0A843V5F2_COLES|nr:hypothetical protein [Colocasia esculenta]
MAPVVSTTVSSLVLAISLAAAMIIFPAHAANPPPIFAFGDSLSDVGNNNALPDGFHANFAHYGVDFPGGVATGRFTNGYNFVDVIAKQIGFDQSPPPFVDVTEENLSVKQGVNFASGGSGILLECMDDTGTTKTCFTMREQIDNFKSVKTLLEKKIGADATKKLLSESLFLFTCGSNDLGYVIEHDLLNVEKFVANMNTTFSSQLRELYELGGRKFAVANVPDGGRIPIVQVLNNGPIEQFINFYAQAFNDAEAAMLGELSSTLPGMKYSIGNTYAVIVDATSNPEKYGLKNVVQPCCGEVALVNGEVELTPCSPTSRLCSNRSEYAFWDQIHPTYAVVKYAGEVFYSGDLAYAAPINLKQLVGDDQKAPRACGVSLRGVGSFEAM